jgi:hypothetical protein
MSANIALWNPRQGVKIPPSVTSPRDITGYAKQLNPRERDQLVLALESGNYEMATSFLWSKTAAGLKKQIASLGMEFVGEMLDRTDITQSSSYQVLTDYDALRLAEELGMFTPTQSMRLNRVQQMISHFSEPSREEDDEEDRQMNPEEAVDCLRTCIQSVLGQDRLDAAIEFAAFRRELEEHSFAIDDPKIQSLISSPYFFQRTTLRVLLGLAKTEKGAQIEHCLANINIILPAIWSNMLKADRYLVGRVYSDVYNDGRKIAASGLRKALLQVKGFDFVPEDLRSRTFISSALDLQNIHFAMNNFYNEPTAIKNLYALGTVIPMPAFANCMTAILCVRLGNTYGISVAAQATANKLLSSLSALRWSYYLNDCLPGDNVILGKLTDNNIAQRWCELVNEYSLVNTETKDALVRNLLKHGASASTFSVTKSAMSLYRRFTGEKQ